MTKLLLKYLVPIETEQLSHCQAFASFDACGARPSRTRVPGNARDRQEAALPRSRPGRELPTAPRASAERKGCRCSACPGEQHTQHESSLDYRFFIRQDDQIWEQILPDEENTKQVFLRASGYNSASSAVSLEPVWTVR